MKIRSTSNQPLSNIRSGSAGSSNRKMPAGRKMRATAAKINSASRADSSSKIEVNKTDGFQNSSFNTLGLGTVAKLWDDGKFSDVLNHLETRVAPILDGRLSRMEPSLATSWISDLHVLQHQTIGLANKLTVAENPAEAKRALKLLQTIGSAQTELFEHAVALADVKSPKYAIEAWVVHKDTMKKPGLHSEQSRQNYFVDKAKAFVEKGGNLNDIKPVSLEGLESFKSGEFAEWAVDSFDVARMTNADDPAPGHSLLAWGGDALSAGTMRVFKDDMGKISQVVLGTFSGHFRAGADTVHHMARHVMAAGIPAEKIVIQGGEAGSARAVEVLQRAMGVDGAEAQRAQTKLDAQGMAVNPYLAKPATGEKKAKPSAAEKGAYKAQFVMRQKAALALDDGAILNGSPSMGGGEATQLASAIEETFNKAEQAGTLGGVFETAMNVLVDVLALDDKKLAPAARKKFQQVFNKWQGHEYGQGVKDPSLVFSAAPVQDRSTRIVATLDVKITPAQVRDMLKAGMDVARFNPAHGTTAEIKSSMRMIRNEAAQLGRPISIQMDLPGPKIRLGTFKNPEHKKFNDVFLKAGDIVKVTNENVQGDDKTFPLDLDSLGDDVKVGERIFMNDGLVSVLVKSVKKLANGKAELEAEVLKGGKVWDKKGVNLPDSKLSVPAFTKEDQALLKEMAPELDVVAVSFVRDADDISRVNQFLITEGRPMPVIAKIERREALENLESIAFASDGLMVARGDLGVEIGYENVPLAERAINAAGNAHGKPTMVATEVFMGTTDSSRPTRGDVEGVFNAVAEHGADAIMLGKETSFTENPGDVVRMAGRVLERAESEKSDAPFLVMRDRGEAAKLPLDVNLQKRVAAQKSGQKQMLKGLAGLQQIVEKSSAPTAKKSAQFVQKAASKTAANNDVSDLKALQNVSPERKAIRRELGTTQLFSDLAKGDFAGALVQIEKAVGKIDASALQNQVGDNLAGWMGELHLMQHAAITLNNKLSYQEQPALAKRALQLLQPVADLQTLAFEKAVNIDDKANPTTSVVAWKTHRDTMKKKGLHSAVDRLQYYSAKAASFLEKGGSMSQIKELTLDNLKEMKSGGLLEFAVDAFDQARFYDAEKKPAPGHTVAARGEDVLTAGTMRVFKNKKGEIENVVIGTFSGHFRAGADSLHHLARNLVAVGIPAEKITLQGGEAGGARALEVLHMALGKGGAETQRAMAEAEGKAARYNPFVASNLDTQAQKPNAAQKPQFESFRTQAPAQAQKQQNDFEKMRAKAGLFFGNDEKLTSVKDASSFAKSAAQVLQSAEKFGNPVLYGQTLALVRHAASLSPKDISAEAQKPLLNLAQKYDRHVFGSGELDAAQVLGPRPVGERRARIVATMDPKASPAKVREMLQAGMNVARYNPAHATTAELKATMGMVRSEAAKLGKEVAIQIDLAGPKIRLGMFANPEKKEFNDIFLKAGQNVKLTNADVLGNDAIFPIDFAGLNDVKPGERVFMNDGMVELLVKSASTDKKGHVVLDVEVKKGGKVWDKKGVNLPDTDLKADAVTPEDLEVLTQLLPHVDTVALSFVRGPEDVLRAREKMMQLGKVVPLIAKIERPEAMANLSKIAAIADALMVARGDLGVEIGMENVPQAEREIARIGKTLGKPVMVATEVLKSMAKGSSRPTRGDVEGLYSAIAGQGMDAVMLGKETSFPEHPGEVIAAAARVIEMAEEALTLRNTEADASKPRAGTLMDIRLSR